jgi:hypothetical protein
MDVEGVAYGAIETSHRRGLQTVVGEVTVTRLAYRAKGAENLHRTSRMPRSTCRASVTAVVEDHVVHAGGEPLVPPGAYRRDGDHVATAPLAVFEAAARRERDEHHLSTRPVGLAPAADPEGMVVDRRGVSG